MKSEEEPESYGCLLELTWNGQKTVSAQKVMRVNNLSETVTVLRGFVEDVEINEKVDVIVSDWMDQLLIYDYENIFGSILTTRDRLLKPGGLIIPSRATKILYWNSSKYKCGSPWRETTTRKKNHCQIMANKHHVIS
ncbi:putative protein arginine N-methyltransferase 6 isoform X2 [Apium graveolens]|uniref:putative protein arginine N-methyltransferase 6 isoform X2 n=1 Tax=Apium graveolens TaxID=4045 RepID=UPI003D78C091